MFCGLPRVKKKPIKKKKTANVGSYGRSMRLSSYGVGGWPVNETG